jgi:hypothetical protein
MNRPRRMSALGIIFTLTTFASCAVQAEDVSFKGKRITMIIGSEAGGGTDATGRLIANYLGKYLPGHPSIVVQNMPGAGGVSSVNYLFHQVTPDGLTILMGSESGVDPMVYRTIPNVQYNPKDLEIIGGANRGGTVIFISSNAQDRLFDKTKPPIIIGNVDQMPREAMQPALWGVQYRGWNAKCVTGYEGTNQLMLAFDRGEVDMTSTGNLFQIQERSNAGTLHILNQTGTLRGGRNVMNPQFGPAPLFPDQMAGKIILPDAKAAFAYWEALNSADKWISLPPGAPADIFAAYRRAYDEMSKDKVFLAQGNKISVGFAPISGGDFFGLIKTLAGTPPGALQYMKELMIRQGIHVH